MSKAAPVPRSNLFMISIDPTIDNPASESKPARHGLGWLALILVLPWMTGCESGVSVKDTSRTFRTVVIDAGHGGHDPGARSRWGGLEKNAALDTVLRLDPKLRAAGFKTVLTRKNDTFIPLNERAAISNRQENAIFVSVHFNDAPSRRPYGVETYYRAAPAQKIAARIQNAVTSLPGVASRGVKTANYRVLRRNEYPAVLVEGGFMSNPREGSRCGSPAYHEALAGAIAGAIIAMRGPLQPPKQAPAATEPPSTQASPASALPPAQSAPAATR